MKLECEHISGTFLATIHIYTISSQPNLTAHTTNLTKFNLILKVEQPIICLSLTFPLALIITYHYHYLICMIDISLQYKDTINCLEKAMKISHFNHIMIELCYFSLHQWEIKIHMLWGKCFNIPHWLRSHSTNGRLQHIEELSKSKTRVGIVTRAGNLCTLD